MGCVSVEIQPSQPISDDDVSGLLVLLDRGRQAWIDGELGYSTDLDARQDLVRNDARPAGRLPPRHR